MRLDFFVVQLVAAALSIVVLAGFVLQLYVERVIKNENNVLKEIERSVSAAVSSYSLKEFEKKRRHIGEMPHWIHRLGGLSALILVASSVDPLAGLGFYSLSVCDGLSFNLFAMIFLLIQVIILITSRATFKIAHARPPPLRPLVVFIFVTSLLGGNACVVLNIWTDSLLFTEGVFWFWLVFTEALVLVCFDLVLYYMRNLVKHFQFPAEQQPTVSQHPSPGASPLQGSSSHDLSQPEPASAPTISSPNGDSVPSIRRKANRLVSFATSAAAGGRLLYDDTWIPSRSTSDIRNGDTGLTEAREKDGVDSAATLASTAVGSSSSLQALSREPDDLESTQEFPAMTKSQRSSTNLVVGEGELSLASLSAPRRAILQAAEKAVSSRTPPLVADSAGDSPSSTSAPTTPVKAKAPPAMRGVTKYEREPSESTSRVSSLRASQIPSFSDSFISGAALLGLPRALPSVSRTPSAQQLTPPRSGSPRDPPSVTRVETPRHMSVSIQRIQLALSRLTKFQICIHIVGGAAIAMQVLLALQTLHGEQRSDSITDFQLICRLGLLYSQLAFVACALWFSWLPWQTSSLDVRVISSAAEGFKFQRSKSTRSTALNRSVIQLTVAPVRNPSAENDVVTVGQNELINNARIPLSQRRPSFSKRGAAMLPLNLQGAGQQSHSSEHHHAEPRALVDGSNPDFQLTDDKRVSSSSSLKLPLDQSPSLSETNSLDHLLSAPSSRKWSTLSAPHSPTDTPVTPLTPDNGSLMPLVDEKLRRDRASSSHVSPPVAQELPVVAVRPRRAASSGSRSQSFQDWPSAQLSLPVSAVLSSSSSSRSLLQQQQQQTAKSVPSPPRSPMMSILQVVQEHEAHETEDAKPSQPAASSSPISSIVQNDVVCTEPPVRSISRSNDDELSESITVIHDNADEDGGLVTDNNSSRQSPQSLTAAAAASEDQQPMSIRVWQLSDLGAPSFWSPVLTSSSSANSNVSSSSFSSSSSSSSNTRSNSFLGSDGRVHVPRARKASTAVGSRNSGWRMFIAQNNVPYYHHEATGQTVWERPQDFD